MQKQTCFLFYDIKATQRAGCEICKVHDYYREDNGDTVFFFFGFDNNESERKKLFGSFATSIPEISTLLYTISLKWPAWHNPLKPVIYYGKGFIIERLEDFSVQNKS